MSLTKLLKADPEALSNYRIDQILALAGDGRLKDGSTTSDEFRGYLHSQPISALRRYVQETLTQPFPDSGFVLQDLVNEIGRRLGFEVTNGRYRGVVNKSGHDGLWRSNHANLVVEVKTTDAYRINLSTIATYAETLRSELDCTEVPLGLLYVVGRQDTGDLEAQVRGSRYAWDVRLISADALLNLADLVQVAVDEDTENALRSSLLPIEYTRVDYLVELLTKLAFDIERSIQVDQVLEESQSNSENSDLDPKNASEGQLICLSPDEFREIVLRSLQKDFPARIAKVTKSRYETKNHESIFISVSKRYTRVDQNYWYAFQIKWAEDLRTDGSFLCLAMLDRKYYLRIPGRKAVEFTAWLNNTVKSGSSYWHLSLLEEEGKVLLNLPKAAKLADLSEFKVNL
jgi:hypothetical protein